MIDPSSLIKAAPSIPYDRIPTHGKDQSHTNLNPTKLPQKTFSTEVKDVLGVLDFWTKGNEIKDDHTLQTMDLNAKASCDIKKTGRSHRK